MPITIGSCQYTCSRCLRVRRKPAPFATTLISLRRFADSPPSTGPPKEAASEKRQDGANNGERGALSQRLAQMSEESLETGGRNARNAVEEAEFDNDLLRELQERIASANFKSENASAFAEVHLPSSAGKGTRDVAAAQPWTGKETLEDAALRMLTDAKKPLRISPKIPSPRGPPSRVDTGRSRSGGKAGARLASARESTSNYRMLRDSGLSEQEKEQMRKEMRARFDPSARSAPATIQGLASLANERIENAIARGQFKNLPRGKKIERDYNASSPFIDTTEYLMNKIIQKQDIVPPWIEKQQEVVSAVNKFRGRLRNDWKRHAARSIASMGGTLQEQVRRAKEYARAEAVANPSRRKEEMIHAVDNDGHLSQITLAGELKARETAQGVEEITVAETPIANHATGETNISAPVAEVTVTSATEPSSSPPSSELHATSNIPAHPFRDPTWESTELSYHTLSIDNLNILTRSYNLQAPQLAQKPYYSLARELLSCYADVAPQIPGEIIERAKAGRAKVEVVGHQPGGIMQKFGGEKARVYDEKMTRRYGFKEFWKDFWARD